MDTAWIYNQEQEQNDENSNSQPNARNKNLEFVTAPVVAFVNSSLTVSELAVLTSAEQVHLYFVSSRERL